jgi:hypothetical protein
MLFQQKINKPVKFNKILTNFPILVNYRLLALLTLIHDYLYILTAMKFEVY